VDKDAALKLALAFMERVNMEGWVLADFEREMYAAIAAVKDALGAEAVEPGWQGLTELHAKLIAENSPNVEWAVMLTEQALKEKNT
jgi:hypothetical protein